MMSSLDTLISKAETLARAGDHESAMTIADELARQRPAEARVFSLRAYLYERVRNYPRAIAEASRAIAIDPLEPGFVFSRGRYYLHAGKYRHAADDFTTGLFLCDRLKDDYFTGAFHFLRAEAFVQLGRKNEALADLLQVRDDMKLWTVRLRTKSELLEECNRLP